MIFQLSNWKSELSHASELLIKLLSEGEAPVLVPCADWVEINIRILQHVRDQWTHDQLTPAPHCFSWDPLHHRETNVDPRPQDVIMTQVPGHQALVTHCSGDTDRDLNIWSIVSVCDNTWFSAALIITRRSSSYSGNLWEIPATLGKI